jgi:hypothetical protein
LIGTTGFTTKYMSCGSGLRGEEAKDKPKPKLVKTLQQKV